MPYSDRNLEIIRGDFSINPETGEGTSPYRRGKFRLFPIASRIFTELLKNEGEILSKAHLVDIGWAGELAYQYQLSGQIRLIRTNLGFIEDLDHIRSERGVGYGFFLEPKESS